MALWVLRSLLIWPDYPGGNTKYIIKLKPARILYTAGYTTATTMHCTMKEEK
jgi:hypothetical protein